MTEHQASPPAEQPSPPTFDILPLSADLRKAVDACGYTHPTPVQRAVFEPAARGKSLVVQARTGTGKTAAFGLPILDQLVRKSMPKVQALILTPTRELALQVGNELERLAQFKGTKIVAIYGGAPMGRQIEALEAGAQIVVGTPGRVLDHLRRGTFDASAVRIFVLDEADEMLSMGFAKELHAIVEKLPKERQGLFFSATIPPDIERMAQAQLKDPEFVTLSSDQVGALEINHFVYVMRGGDKRQELVRIIEVEDPESAIVFCNTKDETERMAEALQNKGYDADWLNGDLEQKERERKMAATREGKLRFLVATDVAARGIDISHLTHVINADFPESAEQYVHRTGRTGRAGRTGTAISIVGPKDIGSLYILRLTYKIRPIEKQLPTAGELKTRQEHDIVAFFADAFASRPVDPSDLALARRLFTHPDAEKILAGLMRDHLGAREQTQGRDTKAEAAEARRARNPPPAPSATVDAVAETAPVTRQEGSIPRPPRDDRDRGRGRDREGGRRSMRDREPVPRDPVPREGVARDVAPREAAPREMTAREAAYREPSNRDAVSREAAPREAGPREVGREKRNDAPAATAAAPATRARVPHKSYTNWEPPAEHDDDKPILTASAAPPPLPGFTESLAETERAPLPKQDDRERDDEDANFAQIFVNVGRRDGVRPGDFQRVLEAALAPADTGRIRIRDRNSFVSVRRETLDRAVAALSGQVIGGRSIIAEPAKARPEREPTRA